MVFSWRKKAPVFPKTAPFLPGNPSYFSSEFYVRLALEYSGEQEWSAQEQAAIAECILTGIQENLSSRTLAKEIARILKCAEHDTWQTFAQTAAANVQLWRYLEFMVRAHPLNRWRKASLYIPDLQVFRVPNLFGCPPQCKALWQDEQGKPKLLSLEEVVANGSNYGRTEWRPVVGVVHEGCLCSQIQIYQPELEEAFELLVSHQSQIKGLVDEE